MLFETFRKMRAERPDEPAFLVSSGDRAVPISWRQFTDDISAIVWLIERHMPGGTIAILGENSYEWMVGHAGCLFAGARVVPLDFNLTADEIVQRLTTVGATLLVHSSLYLEKARAVREKMPALRLAGFGTRKTDLFLLAARGALKLGAEGVFDRASVATDRTSMIVFTSGTTSEPRGVELTIAALETFLTAGAATFEIKTGTHSLMLLPLHHIFGVATTYFMLAQGTALGVCPDFRRIYDAVERFSANYLFLVPALADILAAKIEQHAASAEAAFGQPIDWILIGGAPLPRRTYEHLTSLGVPMLTGYGLTETCALFSITPATGDPHVGSAGRCVRLPQVEYRVSDEGELMTRGPHVLRGYYAMPEKTAAAIDAEGWFHTGDLGRIDADGFVWITGRASRTIVLSSGKKIAPEELEEKLLAIPGVREVIVSGEGLTREIRAEVYATIPENTLRHAVSRLNLMLPVYKRISQLVVRAEPFPRTSSGKIRLG